MTSQRNSPGGVSAPTGTRSYAHCKARLFTKRRPKREALTACVNPDGQPVRLTGREAQTLRLLVHVGPAGFTSGETSPLGWARRTSHYVFRLRGYEFPIITTREPTPDGARVARYSLAAPVRIIAKGGCQ